MYGQVPGSSLGHVSGWPFNLSLLSCSEWPFNLSSFLMNMSDTNDKLNMSQGNIFSFVSINLSDSKNFSYISLPFFIFHCLFVLWTCPDTDDKPEMSQVNIFSLSVCLVEYQTTNLNISPGSIYALSLPLSLFLVLSLFFAVYLSVLWTCLI